MNLPPGCTVYDIPGYLDEEITVEFACTECGTVFDVEAIVSPDNTVVYGDCPSCEAQMRYDVGSDA